MILKLGLLFLDCDLSCIYSLVSLCFILYEDSHQAVSGQTRGGGQVQPFPRNVQRLIALPHSRSCCSYTGHSCVPRAHVSLTGAAAHGIPLHTLAKRERGNIGIGVYTLLHVAAPHALGAAAGALSTRCPQGTWRPALLGTVVRWEVNPRETLRAPTMLGKAKGFAVWVATH